jgi:hypothetical protein
VVDHASSVVLSDVHVRLTDAMGRETGRATTDASGIFRLRAPGDGRYRVHASLIGYDTAASDTLAIGRHETVELLFRGRTTNHCTAHLFINGSEVTQLGIRTVDDLLVADWIGGVEVYPSAALAPVEYRRADPCGVVLFWTRDAEPGTSWSWIKVAAAAAFAGFAFILTRQAR